MRLAISDPGGFALKNAVRAAIVVPGAFAFALEVIGLTEMALFAAFGAIALLVFVDFGGLRRVRIAAYLALCASGVATIALGTLCSQSTWLAVVAMGLVGFAILFAGVIDGYVAAGQLALVLSFVVAAMVPAGAGEIPARLAGWGLASLFSLTAIFALWPRRPPDQLRAKAAAAIEAHAALLEARAPARGAGAAIADEDEERIAQLTVEAYEAATRVRNAFVAMPHRPSGTGSRTAALGRLIDDLEWFDALAREQPAPASVSAGFANERGAVEAEVPRALRAGAIRLLENDPGDGGSELSDLSDANGAVGRAFLANVSSGREGDADAVTAELNETYRLRGISFAALQIGRHAVQASGGVGPREPTLVPGAALLRAGRRIAGSHASMRSVWLRNSLRGAAGLALAVLVARVTDTQNGFWVVLGTLSVLRSSALSTGTTVLEAILGTVIGIVLGGLIVAAIGDHTGLLWAVLPFAVLLGVYSPRAISFTAGQAGFTIVVVVLFNLFRPVGWSVGVVRIEDVAIGCAVSLLTGLLLWPRGAASVLREAIGTAYLSAARYLDQTIATLLATDRSAPIEPAAIAASEAALRVDEAVREYLAEHSSARHDIDSLARLIGGATRVRRVARMLDQATALAPLSQFDRETAAIAAACGTFAEAWEGRRDWFEGFGAAIVAGDEPPSLEPEAPDQLAGPTSRLARDHGPRVALGGGGDGRAPPGIAIAWAERYLEGLLALERPLSDAAHAALDDFSPRMFASGRVADAG